MVVAAPAETYALALPDALPTFPKVWSRLQELTSPRSVEEAAVMVMEPAAGSASPFTVASVPPRTLVGRGGVGEGGAVLRDCASENMLRWTNGIFGCESDTGGGGGFAYPFPGDATSTLLSFTGGILVNAAS